jgi:tRNA(fMet)-specific endonuclease VapC
LSLYLLDTDVTVDLLGGVEPTTGFLNALLAAGHELALTPVTVCEVFAGVLPSDRSSFTSILAQFSAMDLTADMGRKAGEYRYDFARRGQALSTPDTLIAAAAHALGAALVTRNRRHYPMSDLTVVFPT